MTHCKIGVWAGLAWWVLSGSLPLAAGDATTSGLRLPAVFSNHMVLQQGMKTPVWGWAHPGEEIAVSINETKERVTAGRDGRWCLTLPPLPAGGPYTMTVTGRRVLRIDDVLVGEVWFCSGQSNMEYKLDGSSYRQPQNSDTYYTELEKHRPSAPDPHLRFFHVSPTRSAVPLEDVVGEWQLCTPETAGRFSAVGYFFGRDLREARNVPVGLIDSCHGGTPAEAWMLEATLLDDEKLSGIVTGWHERGQVYRAAKTAYDDALSRWKADVHVAKERKEAPPAKPQAPAIPPNSWEGNAPQYLFNAMIAPLIPYGIRGVAWYQGESNAHQRRAYQYRDLFPALIRDWRALWGQGEFPFIFVQVPNHTESDPTIGVFPVLRESQTAALTLGRTGMAVTIDIGEADNIHPVNKWTVGERLAKVARFVAYDERDVVHRGPVFEKMAIDGSTARVTFSHAAGGLVVKGEALEGFSVAGADRHFVPAAARVDGASVVVSCEAVNAIVAVRYAWADNPVCTLYGRAGLPAEPFRTDDWPVTTQP